jgi:hypothetical protein
VRVAGGRRSGKVVGHFIREPRFDEITGYEGVKYAFFFFLCFAGKPMLTIEFN